MRAKQGERSDVHAELRADIGAAVGIGIVSGGTAGIADALIQGWIIDCSCAMIRLREVGGLLIAASTEGVHGIARIIDPHWLLNLIEIIQGKGIEAEIEDYRRHRAPHRA